MKKILIPLLMTLLLTANLPLLSFAEEPLLPPPPPPVTDGQDGEDDNPPPPPPEEGEEPPIAPNCTDDPEKETF